MSVFINGMQIISVSEDNFRPDKADLISHNEHNNLIFMKPETLSKFLKRVNKEVELEEAALEKSELEKSGFIG